MSGSDQKWLDGGRGLPPEWIWSFTADAPLVGLELARETGETIVADAAGSVYLLDRRGRILTLSRGLHTLSGIAWSDAGTTGAVVVGDSALTVLNRQLRVVCRHHLDGSPVWGEPWWSNIGDLCITGDGQTVFLAGLNLGIQRFDGAGNSQGTYFIEGTPNRIAATFALKRLVASTVEKGLVWLDSEGEILWTTQTPEEICDLRCDPLGTGIVCGFDSGRVVRLDWGFSAS
jgi:hypothetical protein